LHLVLSLVTLGTFQEKMPSLDGSADMSIFFHVVPLSRERPPGF
jgi:hypothetical protein